ncbi:MAG TPA: DUF6496 domain-containing protein [Rhabdochlamydiaceae bacterium]
MSKKKTKSQKTIKKAFDKFGEGKLHSGSKKGPIVTSRPQATAIALSEGRKTVHKPKKAPNRLYIGTASVA